MTVTVNNSRSVLCPKCGAQATLTVMRDYDGLESVTIETSLICPRGCEVSWDQDAESAEVS